MLKQQKKIWFLSAVRGMVCVLTFVLVFGPSAATASSAFLLNLPVPGTMVQPSPAFVPVLLKGMTVHPEDPLRLDFIVDSGNTDFRNDQLRTESERLVKYFLASMTVPEDDLWVNLSPYEADRIIPTELGRTELGRDLLAQDYILKQLTASLMYPEEDLGEAFWLRVHERARAEFGIEDIPVNTFNKVWILPGRAAVYEHGATVYVVDAKLKVMLEGDYEASQKSREKAYSVHRISRDENLAAPSPWRGGLGRGETRTPNSAPVTRNPQNVSLPGSSGQSTDVDDPDKPEDDTYSIVSLPL